MERKTNHISDTPQLIAPVRNVADIIDICAGVKFINYMSESFHGAPPASRLTAQRFYTHGHGKSWSARTRCIAFGSKCGTLPGLLSGLTTYNVFGSEYTFKIAKGVARKIEMQGNSVVDVTLGGFAKETEALNIAVVAASESINEDINPLTSTFKDAVSSRYNFFVKQLLMLSTTHQYSDTYESAQRVGYPVQLTQPPLPPGPPPPLSPPAHPRSPLHIGVDRLSLRSGCRGGGDGAFCKPKFKSVDELMFAFSTHVIDSVTGVGRPLSPLEPMLDCSKCQPLVFCSAQPVIVQSPEIDYELDFELV